MAPAALMHDLAVELARELPAEVRRELDIDDDEAMVRTALAIGIEDTRAAGRALDERLDALERQEISRRR